MMSEDLRRFLQPDVKRLGLAWLAFLATALGCVGAALAAGRNGFPGGQWDTGLTLAILGSGVVLALVSRLALWRRLAAARTFAAQVPPRPAFARRDGYAELDAFDRGLLGVFTRVRTAYVTAWALQAAVAVLGLGLALATRDASRVFVFAAAALVLLLSTRPRAVRHLERAARPSREAGVRSGIGAGRSSHDAQRSADRDDDPSRRAVDRRP